MQQFKSYFIFSKAHRSGILLLILLLGLTQLGYFLISSQNMPEREDAQWLEVQNEIDSLKLQVATHKDTIYPFNPNFISDYKGYRLGLTVNEIDRLHRFRAQNKYVNSAVEFQQVTQVSDAKLQTLSPYFKFPEWVTRKKDNRSNSYYTFSSKPTEAIVRKDINQASKEDLIAVNGIGEKLADKILIEKEKLGGFVSLEQFQFMWGIRPEALEDIGKRFFVSNNPSIKKIAINELSMKELSQFPYFNYALAKEIVVYRTMNNGIKEIADLTKIKGMPNEKIKIIALYLEF
ncbi:ComEA family DNA-binding protein [Flavobacterium sp.]|jgi:DNA uptake protein ComE-like DNA-binding protein|uniref:ComEA family DNA-binding protein n=1 Tax=Flavobacterium sp. TaxID=239 RepID=UPI0037C041D9